MFESKDLVEDGIRDSMKSGIELLERFPLGSPTSSPGVDLVDPMLYSLINNDPISLARTPGTDIQPRIPNVTTHDYMKSTKYAMVPSDVKVDSEGTACFTSYINNIHPELDAGLYSAISKLLSRHLPMLESTLSDLHGNSCHSTGIPYEPGEGSRDKLFGRNLQIITRIQNIKLVSVFSQLLVSSSHSAHEIDSF